MKNKNNKNLMTIYQVVFTAYLPNEDFCDENHNIFSRREDAEAYIKASPVSSFLKIVKVEVK